MSDSLIIGASGVSANQTMLDVVGNNLANSNTIGFKSQRVNFGDLVYQTLNDATSANAQNLGGTDPIQVGQGVAVGSIDSNNSQGSLESTGGALDMALQGNGYFVARSAAGNVFTRNGAMGIDSQNYMVDPATGNRIQRFGTIGELGASGTAFQVAGNDDIHVPVGASIPGHATSVIDFQGDLSASAAGPQAQVLTTVQPFQSGGVAATAATTLNSLGDNQVPYVAGDQIRLQGKTGSGAAVNVTVPVGPATTLGDIVTAIDANFAGATASIDGTGNLVVQSNTTGPSSLSLVISDVVGDTGQTNWINHTLSATTMGSDGDTVKTGIQVYDTQGTAHNLSLTFQKQGADTWSLTAQLPASDGVLTTSTITGITFNADGSFRSVAAGSALVAQFTGLAAPQTINLSFGTPGGFSGLTQAGGSSSATATSQDGFAPGTLNNLTIGQDGTISGNFSNGQTLAIAQFAVASFANPQGLDRIGSNYFAPNVQSGNPLIGSAQSGGRGSIQQGSLEQSNVNISVEFTQLIIAQQGYQVNARTISVSDQVLQALVNIIH
jgi:flagellar hook protein FlgE